MKPSDKYDFDSTDLCPDGPSEDDIRGWAERRLDELNMDPSDAMDFFECYLDPEGWVRYGVDVYEAIDYLLRWDPRLVADALVQDAKENRCE